MVNVTRILSAPDISTLREAVAAAFEELSVELENAEKIEAIDSRLKVVEEKP